MLNKKKNTPPPQDQEEVTESVIFLPSALFLFERVSLPDSVQSKMAEDYAEEVVGKTSPFPLEKTAWGYLPEKGAKKNRNLLVYSAWGDSPEVREADIGENTFVLPAFVGACGHASKASGWRFLLEKGALTALHFKKDRQFPDQVVSHFEEGVEKDPALAFRLRNRILETLTVEEGEVVEEGLVRLHSAEIEKRKLYLKVERKTDPADNWAFAWKAKIGPEATLFAADVRPKGFILSLRDEKSADRMAARLVWAVIVIFVVMLGLQVYHQLRKAKADRLAEQYAAQQIIVNDVQNKENMIKSMKQFLDTQMHPFDWLMVMNAYRHEDLAFRTVSITNTQAINVTGVARQVGQVNAFTEQLENSGLFNSVNLANLNTSQREVDFVLSLRGKPERPAMPAEPPVEAPASEATGEEATNAE